MLKLIGDSSQIFLFFLPRKGFIGFIGFVEFVGFQQIHVIIVIGRGFCFKNHKTINRY